MLSIYSLLRNYFNYADRKSYIAEKSQSSSKQGTPVRRSTRGRSSSIEQEAVVVDTPRPKTKKIAEGLQPIIEKEEVKCETDKKLQLSPVVNLTSLKNGNPIDQKTLKDVKIRSPIVNLVQLDIKSLPNKDKETEHDIVAASKVSQETKTSLEDDSNLITPNADGSFNFHLNISLSSSNDSQTKHRGLSDKNGELNSSSESNKENENVANQILLEKTINGREWEPMEVESFHMSPQKTNFHDEFSEKPQDSEIKKASVDTDTTKEKDTSNAEEIKVVKASENRETPPSNDASIITDEETLLLSDSGEAEESKHKENQKTNRQESFTWNESGKNEEVVEEIKKEEPNSSQEKSFEQENSLPKKVHSPQETNADIVEEPADNDLLDGKEDGVSVEIMSDDSNNQIAEDACPERESEGITDTSNQKIVEVSDRQPQKLPEEVPKTKEAENEQKTAVESDKLTEEASGDIVTAEETDKQPQKLREEATTETNLESDIAPGKNDKEPQKLTEETLEKMETNREGDIVTAKEMDKQPQKLREEMETNEEIDITAEENDKEPQKSTEDIDDDAQNQEEDPVIADQEALNESRKEREEADADIINNVSNLLDKSDLVTKKVSVIYEDSLALLNPGEEEPGTDKDSPKTKDLSSKLDDYIKKRMSTIEDYNSDDSEDANFVDEEAEEGEEDTPSEDSNQLIDEGESVGSSDSEYGSSNTYDEDDPFIDDSKYDLLDDEDSWELKPPLKKRRIDRSRLPVAEDHVEEVNEDAAKENSSLKPEKRRRLSEEKETTLEAKSPEKPKKSPVHILENIKLERGQGVLVPPAIRVTGATPEKSPSVNATPNTTLEKRSPGRSPSKPSSVVLLENISIQEVQDTELSEQISKVVSMLCTEIKCRHSGSDIKLNLSVDVSNQSTVEPENSSLTESKITAKNTSTPMVQVSTKKQKRNNKSIQVPEETETQVEAEAKITETKRKKKKRGVTETIEDIIEGTKRTIVNHPNEDTSVIKTKKKPQETEESMPTTSFKKPKKTELATEAHDFKRRLRKPVLKPSTSGSVFEEIKVNYFPSELLAAVVENKEKKKAKKFGNAVAVKSADDGSWQVEMLEEPVVSSSHELKKPKKRRALEGCDTKSKKPKIEDEVHPKDYKTKMMYDAKRVKRIDTKSLLKKKQKISNNV